MSSEETHVDEGFVLTLPSQASRPIEHLMWALVLVLLAFIPYLAKSFEAEFIWDDDRHIVQNQALRSPGGLVNIWLPPGRHAAHTALQQPPQYYPLTHTTYWIEYQFFGASPVTYRITNALLHAGSALLAWLILRRLSVPGAWLAAALFAVHPINAESVAWITERKNVLSLLLALGATLAYLRFEWPGFRVQGSGFRDGINPKSKIQNPKSPISDLKSEISDSPSPWLFYTLSLLLFLAAMLSKTVACAMPAAMLVILWWKRRDLLRHAALLAPFFLIGLALAMHTAWLERVRIGAVGADWNYSFAQRILIAGHAVWFYAGKILWPHPLIFTYPLWPVKAGPASQWLYPLAAVLAVAGLALAIRRREGRGAAAAVAIFLVALVPAMGFFNVFPMRYSFVADHFAYFAAVPALALLAAGAARGLERILKGPAFAYVAASASAAVILVLLGVLVLEQLPKYRSNMSLWNHTLAHNDLAWMAHSNKAQQLVQFAQVYLGHEESAEALKHARTAEHHFRRAIAIRPNHVNALIGLSSTHLCMASAAESLAAAKTPVDIEPAKLRATAIDEALLAYRQLSAADAPSVNPVHVWTRLADALRANGAFDQAIEFYQKAFARDGGTTYRVEVARTQQAKGDEAAAIRTLDAILNESPRDVEANMMRGEIHQKRGELDKAFDRFGNVIVADPYNADAYVNRGFLYMERNRPDYAAAHFQKALSLDPQHPGAIKGRNMIAVALQTQATTRVVGTRPATTRASTGPATTQSATMPGTIPATAPSEP